jgi:Carboxypeptidase regulatory-like domain
VLLACVTLLAGSPVGGAPAASRQSGGKITGTVTDAATHNGLPGAFVTASNTLGGEFLGGSAETNSNGEYTIAGLEKGSFNLEVEAEAETSHSEYLNGSVNGVSVSSGSTTSGVDIALTPKKPRNTGSPVASGMPSVAQTLSCSNGSWVGAPTLSYAYNWLSDGNAIGGATKRTYVVKAADRGHNLSCEVTATNSNGHASATSNTLNVAVAPGRPPPPPPPTLSGTSLTNKRFRVAKKDTALVAKAPLGTSFRFTLSAPSRLLIAITRSARGLRHGRHCLLPSPKLRQKHAKKCIRTLSVGTLTRQLEPAGPDRVSFTGRIGHRPLSPGAYKAVLTASGAGGSSIPAALTFTVVR